MARWVRQLLRRRDPAAGRVVGRDDRATRAADRRRGRTRRERAAQPIGNADGNMTELRMDLDQLSPAERRDLANALLRAAWSAALAETRILLLDLLTDVDDVLLADER
jgi:hypothetical protein